MIKLIATKKISARLPIGAEFEMSDRQARMLVAVKVAKPATDKDAKALAAKPTPAKAGGAGRYRTRHMTATNT
jgi:hypothetical protein